MGAHRLLLGGSLSAPGTDGTVHCEAVHTPEPLAFARPGATAELIVRHRLTLSCPLPRSLVAMARVQHLGHEVLKDPSVVSSMALGRRCTSISTELKVLLFLRRLLGAKLGAFPSTDAEDAGVLCRRPSTRLRFAVLVRHGERAVLRAAARSLSDALAEAAGSALRGTASLEGLCRGCQECLPGSNPWVHRLKASAGALEEAAEEVARLSKSLSEELPAAALAQAAALINLWMAGKVASPPTSSASHPFSLPMIGTSVLLSSAHEDRLLLPPLPFLLSPGVSSIPPHPPCPPRR